MLQEVMKSVQEAEKDAQKLNEQAKKQSAEIIEDAYRQAETIRHQLKEAALKDADRAMQEQSGRKTPERRHLTMSSGRKLTC